MFDTMTMTKTVGAVCGSLLVLMLVNWAGDGLYTVGGKEHGGEQSCRHVVCPRPQPNPRRAHRP